MHMRARIAGSCRACCALRAVALETVEGTARAAQGTCAPLETALGLHEAGEKARRRGKVWNGNTRWPDPGNSVRYEMDAGHGPPRTPAVLSSCLGISTTWCRQGKESLSDGAESNVGQAGRGRERAMRVGGVPGSLSRRVLELWIGRDERRLASYSRLSPRPRSPPRPRRRSTPTRR
ncbi:hypothetical protein L227DRAFT_105567 [Lentinus tigrinus ALCF2SS1-6]|uniref:Uncharacterized protein n=1 Tax=Lentinus tigrinus ALCF2SS1-6 TaxID=1328759 RepID=A0A5C2S8E9_9APHY|nr:hypothetical protein L227DRAFT_105567 [Lentinus tigrinus ALCF2SS1-6]